MRINLSRYRAKFCHFIFKTLLILWIHPVFSSPLYDTSQVIFVSPTNSKTLGKMFFFEVKEGDWKEWAAPIDVALGRAGISPSELKREGDGVTPGGTYPIERVYGYANQTQIQIPYIKLGKKDIWVDKPSSKFYNQYLPKKLGKIPGKSVYSNSEIYQLFIVIEYNTKNIEANKGSMIFVHSWSDLQKPTLGCLGIPYADLQKIVHWLDAKKNPTLMILAENPES
jgi:L,D-peptidoglycan transpeptidase YkuD (ErfK/YbiS/YcfS/YnhG family)